LGIRGLVEIKNDISMTLTLFLSFQKFESLKIFFNYIMKNFLTHLNSKKIFQNIGKNKFEIFKLKKISKKLNFE
jgi:hypothetical protein